MKEPEKQHVNENKELEQEIEKLENRLQSEEKTKIPISFIIWPLLRITLHKYFDF